MTLDQIPFKEILVWLLGASVTILIFLLQGQRDKIKTIESQLSDKKYKVYIEVISLFYEAFYRNILSPEITPADAEKAIAQRMVSIKRDMMIYAPDPIFKKFTDWLTSATENAGDANIKHFKILYDLMMLMRKDMGNPKTSLSLDEILLSMMQDREEVKKFKDDNRY